MYSISKVFADFFKDKTPLHQHAEMLMDKLQEGHICVSLSEEEARKLSASEYVSNGNHKTPFVLSRIIYTYNAILNTKPKS